MTAPTTFGASIVPASEQEPAAHVPPSMPDSPALTPAVSRTTLPEEYSGPHVPPHSPFYQHPPSSNELSLPLPGVTPLVVPVHEKVDLESGHDAPPTPASREEHPFSQKMVVEHTRECQMWPSTQTLKQKYKEDKKQRRQAKGGFCAPFRAHWSQLSPRSRILAKLAVALFVVGVAVALGVGISAAVQGGYYVNDGKSSQVHT